MIGSHLLSDPPLLFFLSQVVSFRGHFQDYLIQSLAASNGLKDTNIKLNAELSRWALSTRWCCSLRFLFGFFSTRYQNGALLRTALSLLVGNVIFKTKFCV